VSCLTGAAAARGSPPMDDKQLDAVKRTLRGRLRDATADVTVAAADLRVALDELGRLHQGNERLRRQNRRLRLKLQRAGIEADEPEGADDA
jgi:hypothetical protein